MSDLSYLMQTLGTQDPWVARLIQNSHDFVGENVWPEWFRHTPGAIMLEGFGGGYSVTYVLQWLSKNAVDKLIPGFDKYALPVLERLCQFGIPAATLAWGTIDPEGAQQWFHHYPLHNLGLFMAYVAGSARAQQDLSKREVKPLDDFVKKQWNKLKTKLKPK